MAYIPVADTVEVELFQRLHGQKIENTLYFRLTGGMTGADIIDLWNQLLIWWTTSFKVVLSEDLSLFGAKITDLSTQTGVSMNFNAPTPNPTGDVEFAALPGNVALTVSFRTNSRGRSYRGRNYVAGLAEPSVVGNTVDTSVITGLQDAYTDLISLPTSGGWEWVVVSRYTNNAPRVTGVATLISSASVVDPYVDSQRRRLTGRGQ